MNQQSSCRRTFGYRDFDSNVLASSYPRQCPVNGCLAELSSIPSGRNSFPYCADHGLRLHQNTFVYFNGPDKPQVDKARLRNFIYAPEFVARHVLDSQNKAESHRLGYEMSEDALSWNVFVAFLIANNLQSLVTWLTGQIVKDHVELYLWGSSVDIENMKSSPFAPMNEVRKTLEPDIKRFPTEPDIMLIIPGKLIVCIEAKFASGNPVAVSDLTIHGEKPKSTGDLVQRYLVSKGSWKNESKYIVREKITEPLHGQLFRNVVFAARMAELMGPQVEWHVVNLVSATQWQGKKTARGYSFDDPSERVRSYLAENYRNHFTSHYWETLYTQLVKGNPALFQLEEYFRNKSAHFRPAFNLVLSSKNQGNSE